MEYYWDQYSLVWLDEKNVDDQHKELEPLFRLNTRDLFLFDDVRSCEQWLKSRPTQEKILLISSGSLAKRIVSNVHQLSSIITIYVFSSEPEDHSELTKHFPKIRRIISNEEDLVQVVVEDKFYFENIEDSKSIEIFQARPHTRILDPEYASVIWFKLFLQTLLFPCYLPTSSLPKQLLDLLRRSNSNDKQSFDLIKQFEQTYEKQNPIKWLINNTPIGRLIQKALREKKIPILFHLRFFFQDLYHQFLLNQLFLSRVYRKQVMSRGNIENLQRNINNHLQTNQFLFTTIKSYDITRIDRNENGYETVFIEIDAKSEDGTLPFAYFQTPMNIHHLDQNDMPVIFMPGSIFKMNSLTLNSNFTWILKLSLVPNKELNLLNEKIFKLRTTDDLLTILELLDQSNQSNQANVFCQELLRQFPSEHPLIPQIIDKIIINPKVQSISLEKSKFLLIDITKHLLSQLAFATLKMLRSLTNNSILVFQNASEIELNQLSNKTIYIFTTSRTYPSVEQLTQRSFFYILEDANYSINQIQHYNDSLNMINELTDEVCRCYILEVEDDRRSGNEISSKEKEKLANEIRKQSKEVHRLLCQTNQSIIFTETTIIWLISEDKYDSIIAYTKNLFEKLVSSFLIFNDAEECYSHICTEEHNHSVFLIIDNNSKDQYIYTLQNLNNVKQIYSCDQSSLTDYSDNISSRLAIDLMKHYNQLANLCQNNQDLDQAKDMFSKACHLSELIREL